MGKLQLPEQANLVALTDAEGGGAPLSHAVNGQDGRRIVRAWEKGAGGVAFVVVGEDQPRLARSLKALPESAAHVEFVLQPDRHGQTKAPEPGGRIGQVGLQQTVKLRQRLVVES